MSRCDLNDAVRLSIHLTQNAKGQLMRRSHEMNMTASNLGLTGKSNQLGSLSSGPLVADFTVLERDKTGWVAVGVVTSAAVNSLLYTPHMLVSTGASSDQAVTRLQHRLDDLAAGTRH
jgi:hypothetical protein